MQISFARRENAFLQLYFSSKSNSNFSQKLTTHINMRVPLPLQFNPRYFRFTFCRFNLILSLSSLLLFQSSVPNFNFSSVTSEALLTVSKTLCQFDPITVYEITCFIDVSISFLYNVRTNRNVGTSIR